MAEKVSTLEETELIFEKYLLQSPVNVLQKAALMYGIPDVALKDKSKMQTIRIFRKELDEGDNVDQRLANLTGVVTIFENILGETGEFQSGQSETEEVEVKTKLDLDSRIFELENTLAKLKTDALRGKREEGIEKDSITLLEETLSKTMLKKEFKIMGNINDQKRTDKPSLNYISLIHQIEGGKRSNYSDDEIIAGIIRSMSPGMKLRTLFETLPNLKLPRVRLMLRSYYNERSASELFQLLSNSVQNAEETADEFLIRIYEIRQKLIFARKESGTVAVPFDDALIQSIFINCIETGISSEAIRNKMRPYLVLPQKGQTETDFEMVNDQLIYHMNIATSTELERTEKHKNNNRRRTGVQSIEITDTDVEEQQPSTKKKNTVSFKDTESNQLVATLQAIQSQLGTLRQDVNQLRANSATTITDTNRTMRNRCRNCVVDKRDFCDHCYRCGSTDHFARGCRSATNSLRPR